MSSEAHCCVTANLVHASASPTYSTAHTTYKSVLLVSLTFVSGDEHLPRRYWKNPVTRFRDVVFFIDTSLNWAIVLCCRPAAFLSVAHWVCLWRCHPDRKFEQEEKDQLSFFPLGSKTEPAELLSYGKDWPFLFLLSLSCSVPLPLTSLGWGEALNRGLLLLGVQLRVVSGAKEPCYCGCA